MLNLSILLFCVAIALLDLAEFIFRVRALLNNCPSNGPVLPLSVIGVILFHRLFGHDLPFLSEITEL